MISHGSGSLGWKASLSSDRRRDARHATVEAIKEKIARYEIAWSFSKC
jgi:hypothetical protein